MKNFTTIVFFILCFFSSKGQTWTSSQIANANTAANINQLTKVEKNCIMYINLCRMYPRDFLKYELSNYYGNIKFRDYLKNSTYRASLITHLLNMTPTNALYFNQDCYSNASCFSVEQGDLGTTGHERIKCPKGNFAECCSYGMSDAIDIVMQLLIDHDVPSLGHRTNCLNPAYNKIGVSIANHKVWETCAVIDMIW